MDEDTKFLFVAKQHGRIDIVKRYDNMCYNRFAVTIGNETRFINISNELWAEFDNWTDPNAS